MTTTKAELMTPTLDDLRATMARHGITTLSRGRHKPPGDTCEACVRELVWLARCDAEGRDPVDGWTDQPDGPASLTDGVCQLLNDADWPDDEARTEACLILGTLSDATAPEGWVDAYAEGTIRVVVPLALRRAADIHPDAEHQAALRSAAGRCEQEGTMAAATAARAAMDGGLTLGIAAVAVAKAAATAATAATVAAVRPAAWASAAASVPTLGIALLVASHEGPRPWESQRVADALAACGGAS